MKKAKQCDTCEYCRNGQYTDLCYWDGTPITKTLRQGEIMNKNNDCKNYEKISKIKRMFRSFRKLGI